MNGIKMYRESDEVVVCKNCQAVVSVGYNILQEEEFETFTAKCVENSLCPSCLKKTRIDSIVNDEKILLQTAKNMICVGVL